MDCKVMKAVEQRVEPIEAIIEWRKQSLAPIGGIFPIYRRTVQSQYLVTIRICHPAAAGYRRDKREAHRPPEAEHQLHSTNNAKH